MCPTFIPESGVDTSHDYIWLSCETLCFLAEPIGQSKEEPSWLRIKTNTSLFNQRGFKEWFSSVSDKSLAIQYVSSPHAPFGHSYYSCLCPVKWKSSFISPRQWTASKLFQVHIDNSQSQNKVTSLKSICIIWPPSPRDPTANHDWPRLKVLTLLTLHSSHSSDIIINVHWSPHDSNPNPERGVFGGLQTPLSLDISNEDGPQSKK